MLPVISDISSIVQSSSIFFLISCSVICLTAFGLTSYLGIFVETVSAKPFKLNEDKLTCSE